MGGASAADRRETGVRPLQPTGIPINQISPNVSGLQAFLVIGQKLRILPMQRWLH